MFESIPNWVEGIVGSALGFWLISLIIDKVVAKNFTDEKINKIVEPWAKVSGLAISKFFVRIFGLKGGDKIEEGLISRLFRLIDRYLYRTEYWMKSDNQAAAKNRKVSK
jgi:hypothetical protein